MRFGKRQAALAFGTPVLSLALLGGMAAAAFQPQDVRTAAHPERTERAKPPLPKLEEILDKLVLEGRITATQREAILAAVQQAAHAEEQKRPFNWKGHLEAYLKTSATFLGMTEADLRTALRSGKSLAEIAVTQGKTRVALIAAISAPAIAKVDEALAAAKITAEQAATAKTQIFETAGRLVDAKHEPKAEDKDKDKDRTHKDKDKDKHKDKEREKEERKSEQKMRIDVHKLLADSFRSAVAYLGLEAKAVQEQLRAGKSLGELAATTAGKTRAGLIDAISAPADAKIDQLKADGKLTEEQAARTKAQVDEAAAKIADAKNVRKVTAPGQAKRP